MLSPPAMTVASAVTAGPSCWATARNDPKADGLNARALSGILERIRTGPPLSDQLLAGDAYLVLEDGRMITGEEAVKIAKRQAGLAS